MQQESQKKSEYTELAWADTVWTDAWWEGLEPDPELTVSEWADEYRVLSQKSAAEPGRWRTSRTPYLREIQDILTPTDPTQYVVFMKGSQIGGPLSLDTEVPTHSGFKTMGELQVGDLVFDEKGKVQTVLGVSPVFHDEPCYVVGFDDGSKVRCDWRHLWTVERDNFKGKYTRQTLRTEEIKQQFKVQGRNRFRIPVAGFLHTEGKPLPIGPYTLGAWLGDGNRCSNRITTAEWDAYQIASEIESEGYLVSVEGCEKRWNSVRDIVIDPVKGAKQCRRGHNFSVHGKTKNGKCAQCHRDRSYSAKYGSRRPKPAPGSFGTVTRRIGVYRNKHIPVEYLRASFSQRLRFLQGLMDTDGSCNKAGLCEFYSNDRALAEQVQHLVCSLGIRARLKRRGPSSTGKHTNKDTFTVRFTAYVETPVFTLDRKLSRLNSTGRRSETEFRRITSVEPVESFPTRCIQVSSESNLFLVGRECVPTHNTECGNNWIGYIIDLTPAPTIGVQPTVDLAKRHSKQRIDPMVDECARLREKLTEKRARDGGNTMLQKDFPGGTLILTGANSAVGLRSTPVRFVFLDEVDGYPGDVDNEGDPVMLATARTRTYARRKIFACSTPTIEGQSRIAVEYDQSDQRRYYVPCPHCANMDWIRWENIRWPKGEPEKAWLHCVACEEKITDRHKTLMLENGKWIAKFPERVKAGFHLSALYSPLGWYGWGDAAREWVEAKGNPKKLRVFVNTVLGETWKEKSDVPDWKRLYDRRELYKFATVPKGGLFLTAGADVQADRIEVEVVAWGGGKRSWSVDYRVLTGDTNTSEPWDKLDALLTETFPTETGQELPIGTLGIDSGYNTQEVYNWARRYPITRVLALKGSETLSMILGPPRKVDLNYRGRVVKRGFMYWPVGVSVAKSELYGWLNLEKPLDGQPENPGFCHFPEYDDEHFKQLTAESLVTETNPQGYEKRVWKKTRERNERLDCRVYARAAAYGMGMDRMRSQDWEAMGADMGLVIEQTPAKPEQTPRQSERKPAVQVSKTEPVRTRRKSTYF